MLIMVHEVVYNDSNETVRLLVLDFYDIIVDHQLSSHRNLESRNLIRPLDQLRPPPFREHHRLSPSDV